MPRLYCPVALASGAALDLPAAAARHVQVLRMQPGQQITLFNGEGGEFSAEIERMGRSDVAVRVGAHDAAEREVSRAVHLVVGMPANERMDWLVEKATELGAASIQPVLGQRSVLRLAGERAEKKRAHWQAVAVAACEQCGRNHVPRIHPVLESGEWAKGAQRPVNGLLLSLRAQARTLAETDTGAGEVTLLSGPEGGLTPQEEDAAIALGFLPVLLGTRVLRAETAPLAVLAALTLGR
ncbi:MAG: 16S rRNA (uracil(1498)-N(3))-methyltransferase [Burkholderiales bacterium]|nr:16S rRNA (uracil(1498)-N(3))-methyltransferase [Burkholderiales bacterium]